MRRTCPSRSTVPNFASARRTVRPASSRARYRSRYSCKRSARYCIDWWRSLCVFAVACRVRTTSASAVCGVSRPWETKAVPSQTLCASLQIKHTPWRSGARRPAFRRSKAIADWLANPCLILRFFRGCFKTLAERLILAGLYVSYVCLMAHTERIWMRSGARCAKCLRLYMLMRTRCCKIPRCNYLTLAEADHMPQRWQRHAVQ
jgi:hypothetical protein